MDAPEGTKQVDVFNTDDVTVGTCVKVGEGLGPEVDTLPVIECSKEHSHEIFATPVYFQEDVQPGQEVYPGLAELEAFAQRTCLPAFEGYVGISSFDSVYFISWLVPTLDSFNDEKEKDRRILCIAGRFDAGPITGSIKDAGAAASSST